MVRYAEEASDRWVGFEFRPGDIVISTRSKCGTTWLQMICALLVFQDADLPAPLAELSPWFDWDVEPVEVVRERLDGQEHRRFIKTHTPLAGLPLEPDVTYLVAGRHPLDVATSLYAHGHNIDRDRFEALTGRRSGPPTGTFPEWFDWWLDPGVGPLEVLDSCRVSFTTLPTRGTDRATRTSCSSTTTTCPTTSTGRCAGWPGTWR